MYSSSKARAKRTNKGKYGKKFSRVTFFEEMISRLSYLLFLILKIPKSPSPIKIRLIEIMTEFVMLNDKFPFMISKSSLTITRKYSGMKELKYKQISLKSFMNIFLTQRKQLLSKAEQIMNTLDF